jgi:hypothetical protein
VAIDWKARLLETTTKATAAPALERAVQQVVADGQASLAEVKSFLAERKDVFGDHGEQAAKKAAEALLDSTSPKLAQLMTPSSSGPAAGHKAHNVRLDPTGALPWYAKAQLSPPPLTLIGKGEPVVVDGERFTAADVAALLQLAA